MTSTFLGPNSAFSGFGLAQKKKKEKGCVYSREFLVSLYVDGPAPPELVQHSVGTVAAPHGPLGDMNEREQELFNDTIHPSPLSTTKWQGGRWRRATTTPSTPPGITLDLTEWNYKDPTGVLQGPFHQDLMHDWFNQHFFTPTLLIKRLHETTFETLQTLIQRSDNQFSPFLNAPLQSALPALPPPLPFVAAPDPWSTQQSWNTQPTPIDPFRQDPFIQTDNWYNNTAVQQSYIPQESTWQSNLPSIQNIPSPIGPPILPATYLPPSPELELEIPAFIVESIQALVIEEPSPIIAPISPPAPIQPILLPEPVAIPVIIAAPIVEIKKSVKPTLVSPPTAIVLPPKPSTSAPWSSDSLPSSPSTGPSLKKIQELETREFEKRKAEKILLQKSLALKEAQLVKETLPTSSNWAESSSPAPVSALPWGSTKASSKTFSEIQEEEAARKRENERARETVNVGTAAGIRGYAGSIGQAKPIPGAPWTTVGSPKPSTPNSPVLAKPSIPLVKPVAARPVVAIRSVTVNGPSSINGGYDAENNVPPPSGEFLKWCKDALKGLTVPNLDDFLSVLLSFPLEPTPSILEIISDSVYSNSSTLDGRRFATEFSARRKLDVNARYPGLLKKGVKGSMAEMIRMGGTAVKTAEWNVKVAGGRRKK